MGVFDSLSKYVTSLMVFLTARQTSYKNEKIKNLPASPSQAQLAIGRHK